MTKSIFEMGKAQFFQDVEFAKGDKVRDFVFEEECVTIPTIVIDNYLTSIPDIVQEANSDQDNVEEPHVQNQEIVLEEQTLQLQEPLPLRKSTRERRSAVPDHYIIFFQEHEVGIGVVEDNPINFQAIESSDSQKWINAMNEEIKSIKDNDLWDLSHCLKV